VGILNGADYEIWDPAFDVYLTSNFSAENMAGKGACKIALQEKFGLKPDSRAPLMVFVSRITDQKMADVVAAALPELVDDVAVCVLLGDGEQRLEQQFRDATIRCSERISFRVGYEEPLAHQIIAGGDILLHPARYEPCGLTQLYAMRYGTLPIVRDTGGLHDTVVDANEVTIKQGTATGFKFEGVTSADLVRCAKRALALYGQPLVWRKVQERAMVQDFGWEHSARHYLSIYRGLVPQTVSDREAAALKARLALTG
jgi:starch synthase